MKEKEFENKVKRFLESQGIYRLGAWTPIETNGYYLKRWGGGQYIPAGIPDMQIVIGQLCLEVEIKNETGKLSKLQRLKIKQINNAGGFAICLKPKDFEWFKEKIKLAIELWKMIKKEGLYLNGHDFI